MAGCWLWSRGTDVTSYYAPFTKKSITWTGAAVVLWFAPFGELWDAGEVTQLKLWDAAGEVTLLKLWDAGEVTQLKVLFQLPYKYLWGSKMFWKCCPILVTTYGSSLCLGCLCQMPPSTISPCPLVRSLEVQLAFGSPGVILPAWSHPQPIPELQEG